MHDSVTIFPQVLEKVFDSKDKSGDEIEDKILDLESIDFTINKKNCCSHEKHE